MRVTGTLGAAARRETCRSRDSGAHDNVRRAFDGGPRPAGCGAPPSVRTRSNGQGGRPGDAGVDALVARSAGAAYTNPDEITRD
jgi:hypothetical protein